MFPSMSVWSAIIQKQKYKYKSNVNRNLYGLVYLDQT